MLQNIIYESELYSSTPCSAALKRQNEYNTPQQKQI